MARMQQTAALALFDPTCDAIGGGGAVQPRLKQIRSPRTGAMAGQGALDHHAAARGKLGSVAKKAVLANAALCGQGGGFVLGQQVKAGGEAARGKVNAQAGVLYSSSGRGAGTVCSDKGLGAVQAKADAAASRALPWRACAPGQRVVTVGAHQPTC